MSENSDVKKLPLQPTLPRWWRVLPSMFILMMISTIDGLILNDFIIYRYTTYYHINSSSTPNAREICLNSTREAHNSSGSMSTTTMSPHDDIQASTARLNVYISLAATLPSLITSVILGANCDKIGRKPLIVLPFVGKIIRYCILTATVYYNLSNLWIILSVMFDGIFGSGSLSILSSFAYVTDCTNHKTRTAGIIITDVCISCAKFIPLLTIGIYLQHPNFVQSMLISLGLSVAGFLFSIVFQPESNLTVQHLNFFQKLKQVKFRTAVNVFRVYIVKRPEHKQRTLLLLVSIHLTLIVLLEGYGVMYYLYLYGAPFCFDSWGVSLNSVAQTAATILFTIPFTLTIAKRTDHLILPVLGFLAYMTQLALFAVAGQVWMIYLAVCIGSLCFVLTPVIRSRITKTVEPSEYAVVFILASIFESGGYYAISAMANEIYAVSLSFYPGLVFFVFVLVGVIGILLILILYILEYQSPEVKPRTLSIND